MKYSINKNVNEKAVVQELELEEFLKYALNIELTNPNPPNVFDKEWDEFCKECDELTTSFEEKMKQLK